MAETTEKDWWNLHLRAVRGEVLSVEERACYEAGRAALESEEILNVDLNAVRKSRSALTELDLQRTELEQRRRALESEIARLETRLGEPLRFML
jgi:hypothetical protein